MRIQSLYLQNFRNYAERQLDLSADVTVFSGANGSGKTNLLEAIYCITQGHSFRTRSLADMIRWDEKHFVLRLESLTETSESYTQSLQCGKTLRRVKCGGVESQAVSSLFGRFPLIVMEPADVLLVKGGPAGRRRLLDFLLSQQSADYFDKLKQYQRVLRQRNALLRQGEANNPMFETYTEALSRLGGMLIQMRRVAVQELSGGVREFYSRITNNRETIDIHYNSDIEEGNEAESLRNTLHASIRREQQRGLTLHGPHRDDLVFSVKSHSLREFGSQGQARSAVLALKIAASSWLKENLGRKPIWLLDDIFAELDKNRRNALKDMAEFAGQVFAAAPDAAELPFQDFNHFSTDVDH